MTDQTTTPEPEPKRCEASHPTNSTVVPCVLVLGHDGDHFSTTGCAGSGIHWAPEPEWLTHLRQDMRAAIGSTPITSRLDVIASVATGVAAAHLRPIYAELVNARDEYEGTETRRVELEANVRALGGDPDRMSDPRDHGTAIAAMQREVADRARGGLVSDVLAMEIAKRHMLRMAQASLSAPSRGCPDYRVGNHDCSEECDAPTASEVREAPAGEARPLVDRETGRNGDLVTITGTLRTTGGAGIGILPLTGAYHDWSVDGWRLQLSRPVSPLPDQPGAVIRATSCLFEGVRVLERLDKVKYQAGCWAVPGEAGFWDGGDLDLVGVLYVPAGAAETKAGCS